MNDNRIGGLALIAGAAGSIVTMSIHPTGHDLFAPGAPASVARLNVVAHGLAVASLPLVFLGALALSRRLRSDDRIGVAALVVYGFALSSVMLAAIANGLVATSLARDLLDRAQPDRDGLRLLLHYNWALNQSCTKVFAVGSSLSILLWSTAILKTRALAAGSGIYGLVLGTVVALAVLSGHVRLDVHGFGLIVVGQAIWFVTVGVLLWRSPRAS